MKIQRSNWQRHLWLLAGGTFLISLLGILPAKSAAIPSDQKLSHESSATPKDSPPPASTTADRQSPASSYPYTIGPEDILKIDVWHEPEVSSVVAVRPDGKISLPLVGDVVVDGFTPIKLQEALAVKLQAFIANPEVAVTVQEVKSRKFNVLGEVQHPGSYSLAQPVRVLDAIGMAGGFRDFAKVTKMYVLRRSSSGDNSRLPFNYKEVIKGDDADQNIQLEPGDTVVVP